MIQQGILTDDEPVELLEGFLVVKMSKNPPHSKSTGRVQRHLDTRLPGGFFTRAQEPVTLDDGEPEPDVAVVRGTDEQYTTRHPGPADVPLVVEVADSTVIRDRTMKMRSYARAGIPVYWIVNLLARQVEVYERPTSEPPTYVLSIVLNEQDAVSIVLDGREVGRIPVADLLP
jgi:Uma2 family endonuclease